MLEREDAAREGRQRAWCALGEALVRLTFADARCVLLQEAWTRLAHVPR